MNNVLEMLEKSAKKYPNKIAFIDEKSKISFQSLLILSKKAASALESGAVAVYMKKSCNALAIMLASIQAGGFYSVIDPSLPAQKKVKMCEILNAVAVVCDDELFEGAKELFSDFLVLKASDILQTKINENKLARIRANHISSDILYCNFTSGSTGVPKGVVINHASVIDFIPVFTKTLGLKQSDVFANQAPFDFDMSIKDIFSTLYLGASCLLIPREYFKNPSFLMDFIHSASILSWAVSALVFLSTFKALEYKKPKLRKIIYSGEQIGKKHILYLKNHLKYTKFINVYGPTEITCNCTYHILSKDDFENGLDIIGRAFENERVFLIDENNEILKDKNQIGQICVSGVCLACGYLKGCDDGFCVNENKQRYYKTGDLGFFDEKGLLHIKGRKDFQIKRLGHRIELEEIEKTCQDLLGVQRACAVFKNEKLKIFFEGDASKSDLGAFLRQNLPFYMLPNSIEKLKNLPINKNGKLDRSLLMEQM